VNPLEINLNSNVKLNNGVEMPIFGLGTWDLRGKMGYQAILWALEAGYRLLDTAEVYGNEKRVGLAIKDSGIPREEIFITTKVFNTSQGFENTLKAFQESLRKLDVSYIDLYLIHAPVTNLRLDTWKALEKLLDEGKTRTIGVSNYTTKHLTEQLDHYSTVPAVNQVEFSPFLYQKDLLDFCNSHNIVLEGYSTLTKGVKLNNQTLIDIAKKYMKSTTQILIRWGLQHDVIQIPRSGNKDHIYENADVFDFQIKDDDMLTLDSLNEDFRAYGLDPNNYK
jgi:diketogulonate reductase-like aldo/keto reductase